MFGRYLLLRRIGRGGMAEIFRALQVGRQGVTRQVAIKRMLPHLGQDPHFVDMFINEAKLAALLDHANIVRIYEFGCVEERLYHCLEYVHGVTVMDIIRACLERREPMPVELACLIFCEALYGLDQAHRQADHHGAPLGLVHRDLTPSNLLVSFEGEVKVADFGIAKAAAHSVHTQSGYIKGKFRYMSPEQAHGAELDQRSDLFSLGICFCELLSLRPMFHADGDLATLLKVRAADFVRPREHNPAIPPALEACLLRALAREREARYASAAEWLEELERVVFECGLKRFRSDLKVALRTWFAPLLRRREAELAEESARAQSLLAGLPGPLAGADEKPAQAGVRTLVVDGASLGLGPGRDDRPGSEPGAPPDGPTRDLRPPIRDDQRPTLRDLPAVPGDAGARPTLLDLPAASGPQLDADLGKRRTLQVPVVGGEPPPEADRS